MLTVNKQIIQNTTDVLLLQKGACYSNYQESRKCTVEGREKFFLHIYPLSLPN